MIEYRVPLFWPHIPKGIVDDLAQTLSTRWIGQGPKVDEFEQTIGEMFRLKYPVMVNSGTSALEIAYRLVDLRPGDEVITSPLTCTATNIPLLRRGAKIVFADIDPNTLTITKETVEAVLTEKTKAIVGVSLGGVQCSILPDDYDIPVVMDAAQALGQRTGDYIVYSFQAIKHITCGDGGLLVCPDKAMYKRAKLLRWFGIDREKKRANDWQAYKEREMVFDIWEAGYKFQPTDIDATFGLAGLREYQKIMNYRMSIFDIYKYMLDGKYGIKVVDGDTNFYWLATILVDDRDGLVRHLDNVGIETNLVQVRNDLFAIFGGRRQDLPNMNAIEDRYLSIPLNTKMAIDDAYYVAEKILEYYGG